MSAARYSQDRRRVVHLLGRAGVMAAARGPGLAAAARARNEANPNRPAFAPHGITPPEPDAEADERAVEEP